VETARILAELILELRPLETGDLLEGNHGVFHLQVHAPA